MTHQERYKFIEKTINHDIKEVFICIEEKDYRHIETVIDKVNNPEITRYCATI